MSSITYRLVRELFEAQSERGAMNLSIDLCSTEGFSISVGPHPGFSDNGPFVVGIKFFGPERTFLELEFTPEDDLPARQLADALTAWADWIEAADAKERESQADESDGCEQSEPQNKESK